MIVTFVLVLIELVVVGVVATQVVCFVVALF